MKAVKNRNDMIISGEYQKHNSFYNTGVKMPDSVILFDESRIILHMSRSAKKRFGARLIGADMRAIMNPGEYLLLTKLMSSAKRSCGCLQLLAFDGPATAVYSGFSIRGTKLYACVISRGDPVKLRQLVNSEGFDLMNPAKVSQLYDDIFFGASNGTGIRGSDLAEFYHACAGLASTLTRPFTFKPDKRYIEVGSIVALWKRATEESTMVYYDPLKTLRYDLYADHTFLATLFTAIHSLIRNGKAPALHIRKEETDIVFEFCAEFADAPEIFPTEAVSRVGYFEWFALFFIESLAEVCGMPVKISCQKGLTALTVYAPCTASRTALHTDFDDPLLALFLDYAKDIF